MAEPGSERRVSSRLPVAGTIDLRYGDRRVEAELVNVSRGGLGVKLGERFRVGTTLKVRSIAALGQTWLLVAEVTVAWAAGRRDAEPDAPTSVGLRFLAPNPVALEVLEAFLAAVRG